MSQANRDTHGERVSQVTEQRVYMVLVKWARNRGNHRTAFTANLKHKQDTLLSEMSKKLGVLQQTFFPKVPKTDLCNS
jgi:hypothetical protein